MMKTFIILSVCMIACFLQFTKADQKCLDYMKEMYNKAKDLEANGELDECMKAEGMPKLGENQEEFQKNMCEKMKSWKDKTEEEMKAYKGCMKNFYQKARPEGDKPESCKPFWKEQYEKCMKN